MDCVKKSFEGSDFSRDDNILLREDAEKWKVYGSGFWPSIVINERTYRGDLIPDDVFGAICAGFAKLPGYCK